MPILRRSLLLLILTACLVPAMPGGAALAADKPEDAAEYETVFEKKSSAVETVVPMVDADGTWRVSGYFVR